MTHRLAWSGVETVLQRLQVLPRIPRFWQLIEVRNPDELFHPYARSVIRREAEKESGGLGSSHTTPCGAAVPARPPTRSSETTHLCRRPQWVSGATRRGTRVVVHPAYF